MDTLTINTAEIDRRLNNFYYSNPTIDLSYIEKISSSTGIFQHASFNIPNYHHGYCIDDNCRALLLLMMAQKQENLGIEHPLFSSYLSFIFYAQNEDGSFKNFMSYDLRFLEDKGSEDSQGRTIWCLGYLLGNESFDHYWPVARGIFDRGIDQLLELKSARAISYALLGLLHYQERYPEDQHVLNLIQSLTKFLEVEFQMCATDEWPWFEEIISYDNAMIPLALFRAGKQLNNQELLIIAEKSFDFLDSILFRGDHLSLIGNENWLKKNGEVCTYGQQPIEIPGILWLYQEVYNIDPNPLYIDRIKRSFLWYLGLNDQRMSLFNAQDNSCYDGLESYGVNKNQGAESNISFWMSYLLIKEMIFKEGLISRMQTDI
ncbi:MULTISPECIES: hypothetical protein [Sphingobacterium]|uniref:Glycosyltransferase n=1 Tax=Sphingobacterium tenebrionis TaxID=3111775 RepID=A0ABU8I6K4_9SPHI|nr:hypothetical protein [Sphingobacterium sp. 1.A.4]